MRADYFNQFKETIQNDENVFFLMGDTGYNLVEPIFEQCPDRALNVGVAEQNMMGIAAGLSNVGFKVICYGISNFIIFRCLEQIRNDICLHDYPVTLVGTSTGLDNGALWATHYVVDHIGCSQALPNISIYSPSSVESINKIYEETMKLPHPSYIRITKSSFLEGKNIESINRFILKNENSENLIISHGRMVQRSLEVSKIYSDVSIFAMDKIKPLEESKLEDLLREYKQVIVIEDNFSSGLYNSICQFVAEKGFHGLNLHSISTPEDYGKEIGDTAYLDDKFGLSAEKIANFLKNLKNSL